MSRWGKRLVAFGVLFGVLYGVGLLLESFVIEYVVRVVLLCGIYAILAVGLNLINGTTGQFSLGHAGFMAIGAYGTAVTVIELERRFGGALALLPAPVSHTVVFVVGLVAAALLAAIAGFLVGAPSLRLRGDYLAIVTLGFGEIVRLLFNNAESMGGATGYSGGRPLGLPLYTNFFGVFATAALVIVFVRNLTFSSTGRALFAIRHDEIASEALGLPVARLKILAFVLSSAIAGIGGGLFAHLQSTIRPDDFRLDRSIDIIVMIILGGLGSITGAVLGAVFITVSLELMREVQQYRMIAYALLIIVMIIVRPQGLFGRGTLDALRPLARLRGRLLNSAPVVEERRS